MQSGCKQCSEAPAAFVLSLLSLGRPLAAVLQQAALDMQRQLEAELDAEHRRAAQLQEALQRAQEAADRQQQLVAEGAAHTGWGAACFCESHRLSQHRTRTVLK
jgi:methylthioribose-1-phosphate isomerase